MREKAKQIIKHPLIYGGGIVIIGSLAANFFYFLFNLFMSRNLSVAEYGVLASIMSLISYPAFIANAVSPMIVRFAGGYFAVDNLSFARGLFIKVFKFLSITAVVLCTLFFFLIPSISHFFHIENKVILILTNFIIFFSFISVINTAFLQAKLAFGFQVIMNLTTALLKFTLGMILVLLGFSLTGATLAILISGLGGYLMTFFPLKFIFNKQYASPKISSKDLFNYGFPSALTFFGLTSLISSDILLVKHFFNSYEAGLYAGLSLVGRVIFYISGPIGSVMFPLIVQKHEKKENVTNTLILSLGIVLIPSLFLSVVYYFFPQFIILFFLKNESYLQISSYIGYFGITIALYALLALLVNFYLSIKKTKIYFPIILGAIMKIILIYTYHESFLQIITITFVITFLLVLCLLLYYPYAKKRKI